MDDLGTLTCSLQTIQVAGYDYVSSAKSRWQTGRMGAMGFCTFLLFQIRSLHECETRAHSTLMLGMGNDVLALDMH